MTDCGEHEHGHDNEQVEGGLASTTDIVPLLQAQGPRACPFVTTTITLPNLPRDQAGLSTSDGDEQRRQSLIPEGFQCWWNASVMIFQLALVFENR